MNKELKPAKIILYILLIAPFFQVELLENLIPLMGKGYTLWQLLAGAAFVYVWSRDKVRIRDFSRIHLLFAALLLVMVIHSRGAECGDDPSVSEGDVPIRESPGGELAAGL